MELKDATPVIVCIALLTMGLITGGMVFYGASFLLLLVIAADIFWLWFSIKDLKSRLSAEFDVPGHNWRPGSVVTISGRVRYSGTARYNVRFSWKVEGPVLVLRPMIEEGVLSKDNLVQQSMDIQSTKIGVITIHPLYVFLESHFFRDGIGLGRVQQPVISVGLNYAHVQARSSLNRMIQYTDLLRDSNAGSHVGVDIYNVRPYIPGDRLRNIDWVRSSRENKLIVKVYDESKVKPVFFLIDVDASMATGEKMSELDSAINLVSTLASKLLIDSTMFGVISFSKSGIVSLKHMGIGRDHIKSTKAMLSSLVPVEESESRRVVSIPVNHADNISTILGDVEGFEVFATVMKEALREHVVNVKGDGYMRAVLKACQSARDPCQIILITNLSMGVASLLNGIRTARYYGHTVSVVLTPHIWFEGKEQIDIDKFYERYQDVKKSITSIRSLGNVKVVDLYSGDKVEEVLYRNISFDPTVGIRR